MDKPHPMCIILICLINLGRKCVLVDNDDKSGDDLPSLEKFFQIAPHPNIITKASKTEHTLQHLE